MTVLRRRLSLIGLVMLLLQSAALTMSPIASCCTTAAQAAQDDDDCCKGLAPGQMCPLHHHRTPSNGSSQNHDDSGGAALRCGCSAMDPALISLAFGLGVVPAGVSVGVTPLSIGVDSRAESAVTAPFDIETPPPRL